MTQHAENFPHKEVFVIIGCVAIFTLLETNMMRCSQHRMNKFVGANHWSLVLRRHFVMAMTLSVVVDHKISSFFVTIEINFLT